jgi:hypothetical protein
MSTPRALALRIREEWPNISPFAKPYVDAMALCETWDSPYCAEDARSMGLYFLVNAAGFRGSAAKEIKAQIKAAVK